MKEIIKVLLQEGIDEDMINKVLDLIEEEYEVISELEDSTVNSVLSKRQQNFDNSQDENKIIDLGYKLANTKELVQKRKDRKYRKEHPIKAFLTGR